ncbi:MAG: hypothetical protein D6776_07815, partial [Planctomycetota bacterium]
MVTMRGSKRTGWVLFVLAVLGLGLGPAVGGGRARAQDAFSWTAPERWGEGPLVVAFPDGARLELSSELRLALRRGDGRPAALPVRAAAAQRDERGVRYAAAVGGADLLYRARPDRLESWIVLERLPEAWAGLDARGAEVVLIERLRLPRGWSLAGFAPGNRLGLEAARSVRDEAGRERLRLLAPRVFEWRGQGPVPGGEAPVRGTLEYGHDGAITVTTSLPLSWLLAPDRIWPVVLDPTLLVRTPEEVTATPADLELAPEPHHWNVVALAAASATADWELSFGGRSSVDGPGRADVLVADGHRGAIVDTRGRATLAGSAGAANARVEHAAVESLRVGEPLDFDWESERVVHAWELDVRPGDVGVPLRWSVDGPAGLRWWLFAPGSDAAWHPSTDATSGESVSNTATVVKFRRPGYWLLVVCRDAGSAPAGSVSIRWKAPPAALQLVPGRVVTTDADAVAAQWQPFEIAPQANAWNVVACVANDPMDDWDLRLGSVDSGVTGPQADVLAFDGRQAPVSPTHGAVLLSSGQRGARLELLDVHPAPLGVTSTASWAADEVGCVFEVEVSQPGARLLSVEAPGYAEWLVLGPRSQGTSRWFAPYGSRNSSGPTPVPVRFRQAGTYAVVVLAHASVPPQPGSATLRWQPVPSLVQGQPRSVTGPTPFRFTPQTGAWNAVAVVATDASEDWDIEAGSASSWEWDPDTDLVLFDGVQATVAATEGDVSVSGALQPAVLEHAAVQRTSYGRGVSLPWAAG